MTHVFARIRTLYLTTRKIRRLNTLSLKTEQRCNTRSFVPYDTITCFKEIIIDYNVSLTFINDRPGNSTNSCSYKIVE